MRHITSKSNLQQRCLFNTLARLKASRKLCYIHSISTGARFLPIKCIKRYTNIPFMQHQWKILYIFIYLYHMHIHIYICGPMYIFYFSVHLLSAVSKKTSRNVGFQTPCLHLCVAKHQTACTIRLIFLRCSPGRYIGQKNVKTKKTNIEVTSESEEHAFSIDF